MGEYADFAKKYIEISTKLKSKGISAKERSELNEALSDVFFNMKYNKKEYDKLSEENKELVDYNFLWLLEKDVADKVVRGFDTFDSADFDADIEIYNKFPVPDNEIELKRIKYAREHFGK